MDFLIHSCEGVKSSEGRIERKDKHARISNTSVSLQVEERESNVYGKVQSLLDVILRLPDNVTESKKEIN